MVKHGLCVPDLVLNPQKDAGDARAQQWVAQNVNRTRYDDVTGEHTDKPTAPVCIILRNDVNKVFEIKQMTPPHMSSMESEFIIRLSNVYGCK